MNIDPKLRNTIKKMMKIARQDDVAAFSIAISKTHSEFRFDFPSWGVISLNKNGELRFKSKREDFTSLDSQKEATTSSVHVLMQFLDILALSFQNIDKIVQQLKLHMQIDHSPFVGFVPADPDENE